MAYIQFLWFCCKKSTIFPAILVKENRFNLDSQRFAAFKFFIGIFDEASVKWVNEAGETGYPVTSLGREDDEKKECIES